MEFREIGKVEKERALEFGSAEKRRVLREFSVWEKEQKGNKGSKRENNTIKKVFIATNLTPKK